jgi:type VI secretion system protein VasD
MVSSINANPDARNRPSPVVVRVFELKSLAAFSSADFFSLWDRDKETLGSELVSREEYTLLPGDTRLQDCKLQVDAQYVGVIAAFRDLEHSQWRATLEIPRGKVKTITVQVTGKTLALEAK